MVTDKPNAWDEETQSWILSIVEIREKKHKIKRDLKQLIINPSGFESFTNSTFLKL